LDNIFETLSGTEDARGMLAIEDGLVELGFDRERAKVINEKAYSFFKASTNATIDGINEAFPDHSESVMALMLWMNAMTEWAREKEHYLPLISILVRSVAPNRGNN
jgi:hypothetical protein